MQRSLNATIAGCLVVVAAGPLTPNTVVPLRPTDRELVHAHQTESYRPRHKGQIDLATGLYIREDEDIVVPGTPALILRRTYLSGHRVPTEFGIGTTHDGEWFLIGDGQQFQWASLIFADGSRVKFDRVSQGTSIFNAVYEHRATPGQWQGARLSWAWLGWVLRRPDGSVFTFRSCGPNSFETCSIVESRDPHGHAIHYRRDASGRLLKMEAQPDRWIAFDYDSQKRITRAFDHAGREVRYEYDLKGRLTRVEGLEGRVHRYGYTDRDEMATIADPGTTIENSYDENGRCVRQVNRFPGEPDPFIFDVAYRTDGDAVVQTDIKRSNGTWSRYTFGKGRYTTSEAWGRRDSESGQITYNRDATTNIVTALTVTCPDQAGRPLRHSRVVTLGRHEQVQQDLIEMHCIK